MKPALNAYDIRKDFPILQRKIGDKHLVYLDNAATSQRPIQVIKALEEFYILHNANIHRAIHTLSRESTELYEEAHEKARKFINARYFEEIIFTRNTTEAINLVAYSLSFNLRPGDEVVTTVMEHHSNMVPWQMLRDHFGIELKFAKLDSKDCLDLDHLNSLITDKTKLVAVTHVSNVLGVVNPIEEIVRMAHSRGALCLVDGAQSVPHMPVDVQKMDVDFLAFSSHKMLGPTGIGVLYARKELLEKMEPFLRGGDMISTVTVEKPEWNKLPWRFEAGTSNFADGYAFGVAIDYLEKIGMEAIFLHEKEIAKHTIDRLVNEVEGLKILGPTENRIGVISFYFEDIPPDLIGLALDEEGIAIRTGCHCAQPLHEHFGISGTARASFYLYNTLEEADYFVDKLKEIVARYRNS